MPHWQVNIKRRFFCNGQLSLRKACHHSEKASFLLPPRREAVHCTAIPALHQKTMPAKLRAWLGR
jgi:hypothetical protein